MPYFLPTVQCTDTLFGGFGLSAHHVSPDEVCIPNLSSILLAVPDLMLKSIDNFIQFPPTQIFAYVVLCTT